MASTFSNIKTFLFGKTIICPYCLTKIKSRQAITECSNITCYKPLPIQYVQKYNDAPPLFIQIVGPTGVGKTTYLQALTAMLMKANNMLGDGYAYAPLTQESLNYVQNVRRFMKTREVPEPTSTSLENRLEPYIMHLFNLEGWGNRTLVISDIGGEVFQTFDFPLEHAPYIMCDTTILMISLEDLEDPDKHLEMDDFMSSYIQAIARHDDKRRTRKVVVVLSKADKILDNKLQDMPNLKNYLEGDPIALAVEKDRSEDNPLRNNTLEEPPPRQDQDKQDNDQSENNSSNQAAQAASTAPVSTPAKKNSDNCLKIKSTSSSKKRSDLLNVSECIKTWIQEKYRSAKNLCELAKENDIELRFTIISSGELDSQNEIKLRRVLDPFFWLLELERASAFN